MPNLRKTKKQKEMGKEIIELLRARGNEDFLTSTPYSRKKLSALIDAGADLEQKNGLHGGTPLAIAARQGDKDLVIELLAHGAKVDGEASCRPLLMAAGWNHPAIAQILIDHGARTNLKENTGSRRTALEIAKECGHHKIARLLTKQGQKENTPIQQDFSNASAPAIAAEQEYIQAVRPLTFKPRLP